MEQDSAFLAQLSDKINKIVDEVVVLWAKKLEEWDERASKAHYEDDEKGVEAADKGFQSDCEKLRRLPAIGDQRDQ